MSSAVTDVDVRTLCLKPGQLVPPKKPLYRIVGDIDEGAFSKVWLARDTQAKERLGADFHCPLAYSLTSTRKSATDQPLF